MLVAKLAVNAFQKLRKQRFARQVARRLGHFVHQFAGILGQDHRLAQIEIARQPSLPVIEIEVEHRAVHVPVDVPTLLQGIGKVLRGQPRHHDLLVLEQVQASVGVGGDVAHVDAIQANPRLIPIVGVPVQLQGLPMHPARQREGAVVEQLVGIRPEAAFGGPVEVLAHREVGGEGSELVEEGDGALERHLKGTRIERPRPEFRDRKFPLIDRFGVLDGIEDEGVLGSVLRIEAQPPSEDEVVGRDRLPIAPARIGAQMEGGTAFVDVPLLRHPWRQFAPVVVAQQPFHDVAEHDAADLVGGPGAVELRRLLGQHHGDGVVGRVHRWRHPARGGGKARQQIEPPHQAGQANHDGHAKQRQLPGGGAVKRGFAAWIGRLGHFEANRSGSSAAWAPNRHRPRVQQRRLDLAQATRRRRCRRESRRHPKIESWAQHSKTGRTLTAARACPGPATSCGSSRSACSHLAWSFPAR